jgi:hypothetical protein
MTDTRIHDSIETWSSSNICTLCTMDGPHMTRDVITEAVWFANRSQLLEVLRLVFDDYPKYDMATSRKAV